MHKSKDRKNSERCRHSSMRYDITPLRKRIPWHSSRITIETVTNETERHTHGAMKSREKRMRKRRSVRLSAPRPKLRRMTSRISGQVRITTMLDKYGVLASLTLQHDQVRCRDCVEFGLLAVVRLYHADHWLNSPQSLSTKGRRMKVALSTADAQSHRLLAERGVGTTSPSGVIPFRNLKRSLPVERTTVRQLCFRR